MFFPEETYGLFQNFIYPFPMRIYKWRWGISDSKWKTTQKFNNYKNVPSGAIMVYMNVPSSVRDRATRYTMQRFIIHGISYV